MGGGKGCLPDRGNSVPEGPGARGTLGAKSLSTDGKLEGDR